MDKTIYTPEAAKKKGYVALTYPCKIHSPRHTIKKRDTEWYQKYLKDLEATEAILVEARHGVEFWRRASKMNIYREEFNDNIARSINPYVRH